MNRRLAALFGALVLCLTTIAPAIAQPSKSVAGPVSAGPAAPASAVDQTKVPHYFGPYPNWANSPLTAPDATVVITGDGTAAAAVARAIASCQSLSRPAVVLAPGLVTGSARSASMSIRWKPA